jgi:hypothetical protein
MSSKSISFLQHAEEKISKKLMNEKLTNGMRAKLERNLNNVKRKLQMGGRRTKRSKRSKRSNRTRRHR